MNFGNEETNDVEETKQRMLSLDYSNTSASLASNVWLHHSASAGHIPPCNNNNNIEAMSIENSIPLNTSPLSTSSNGNANEIRSSNDGDAEGVWSPDIDQAFHEALQIYPPCGRRKIILSDEGKMYGRNELIARYIKIRCGKSRTRKQVSSHIQVLARKKQREEQARVKSHRDHNSLTEPNTNSSTISNNPIAASVSATIFPPTSSKNSLQKQQKIKSESEELMDGGHLLNNNNNITTSSSTNQIQNVSLAINASQQPLANLITSINRDQIASVQAQVARAASAISHNSVNWPSLIVTNNNNNQHLMTGAQLYMTSPNPCSSNVVASIPFISSNGNNYQFNSEASSSSSSEQIIFTTTPSSAFTCATTTTINKLTTISSSSFVLNEFTAYIEEQDLIKMEENNNNNRQQGRIELVHIPKTSGAPLERISLELIQSKYPPILQKLFKEGPKDAFFLAKCWANMNFEINDEQNALFAVDSYYESTAGKYDIIVSTKVCSFGNEVVEKVEIYSPINENEEDNDDIGILTKPKIWHFRLEKSPMCEYMVRFISELKRLQEPSLMNSVLENFTVLQIVSNKQSEETLMVIAFIFEVREDGEDEIYTNIYRLTE